MYIFIYVYVFINIFCLCQAACGILVSGPGTLQWNCRVIITGPPRNFLALYIYLGFSNSALETIQIQNSVKKARHKYIYIYYMYICTFIDYMRYIFNKIRFAYQVHIYIKQKFI